MKSVAVYPSRREITLVDHPAPTSLGDTEARLEILEVGVCGTDREIARFDYGEPPKGSEYLVLGHESLGRVVEVGKKVSRVKVGDLVVTMVRRPCDVPTCTACRNGRQDFCFTGQFTERGIRGRHGFMTEQVVDDEKYMHVVPEALRHVGILTEPLTIAQKALAQLRAIHDRLPWTAGADFRTYKPRALVLGAGPVGLLGAMSLKVAGFDTLVYSRSRKPNDKSNLSESFDVPYIAAEKHPVEDLPKLAGQIDVVYEATGAAQVSFEVLKVLGPNGVFVFTGVPGRKGPVPTDLSFLMRNMVLQNQMVFGTVNAGPDAFENAISALAEFEKRWPVPLAALITGRYPMEKARELLQDGSGGIKDVIQVRS
jgi:threonine dehydrogenase-like Zn-dependent dehydrogenase